MSVAALLLADSRFPAGGHAHSGGVEPAVTAGDVTGLVTLEAFLRGRLSTAGLVAAAIAASACARAGGASRGTSGCACCGTSGGASCGASGGACCGTSGDACCGTFPDASCGTSGGAGGEPTAGFPDHAWWGELDAEADARMPSPAQREASRRQGRALSRAARAAWPEAQGLADAIGAARTARPAARDGDTRRAGYRDGTGYQDRPGYRDGPHHAVVLGAAAAAAGCGPGEAARIAAYQAVAGPVSAAVRLLALDPMRATAVLARLAGQIERVAAEGARYAKAPLAELPCPSAPALDLLAETHFEAEVRLFES